MIPSSLPLLLVPWKPTSNSILPSLKGKVPNSSSPKGSGTATALTSFVPSTILKPLKAFTISLIRPWTPLKILATSLPGGNSWVTANCKGYKHHKYLLLEE